MKLKPGTKAPKFKLPSTDGNIFELGKIKKNIIFIIIYREIILIEEIPAEAHDELPPHGLIKRSVAPADPAFLASFVK